MTPLVPPTIRLSGIVKRFERVGGERVVAVDDVSLDIQPGEFMVLLGPSGCGKTTLLRAIAGLEQPDAGEIVLDGRRVFSSADSINVPPEKRGVSMFFQSYALWPHMTVFENVAYPLRSRNVPQGEIDTQVRAMLDRVRCGHLAQQFPGAISGGQQQRVALARTLIAGNKIVLFDEPMSNVDAAVRAQLRIELLELQRTIGFSAIYITHDQSEALALANRIAILSAGRVVQLATPIDLYRHPNSAYVARFLGTVNEVAGTVVERNGDRIEIQTSIGRALAVPARGVSDYSIGQNVVVIGRPEQYRLSLERPSGANAWPAKLHAALFLGTHFEYALDVSGVPVRVWTMQGIDVAAESVVWLTIDPESLLVFDAASGRGI